MKPIVSRWSSRKVRMRDRTRILSIRFHCNRVTDLNVEKYGRSPALRITRVRPAVILQDDRFDATESITICVMTTDPAEAPLFRVPIAPNERNGLNTLSRLMVDKITTVPKNKLGHRIGHLDVKDIERVDQAILIFLGLGG